MARFVVGVVAGIVITTLSGAALQLHAKDMGDGADLTGVDGSGPEPASAVSSAVPDLTVESPVAQVPAYGIWDELAACEASSDWHSASNPIYKGGLQFDAQTWARHGGLEFAWRADFATRAEQIIVGQRTLAAQGWGAWPFCSRKLGLR